MDIKKAFYENTRALMVPVGNLHQYRQNAHWIIIRDEDDRNYYGWPDHPPFVPGVSPQSTYPKFAWFAIFEVRVDPRAYERVMNDLNPFEHDPPCWMSSTQWTMGYKYVM